MRAELPAHYPYGGYENDPRQAMLMFVLLAVAAVVAVVLITAAVMVA